jgi:hypothetical protein
MLLGHALVPHHHEMAQQHPYIGVDSSGFLGDLFDLNMGDNHLEEIRLNEFEEEFVDLAQSDSDIALLGTWLSLPPIEGMIDESPKSKAASELIIRLLREAAPRRGPPQE